MDTLHRAFANGRVTRAPTPYNTFIAYAKSLDVEAAEAYWRDQLKDAQGASFPPPVRHAGPAQTKTMTEDIVFPVSKQCPVTKATVVRAAWAFVLSLYSGIDRSTESIDAHAQGSANQQPVKPISFH